MWKELLVFSLAFCLSLISLQFFKPNVELCPLNTVSNPTVSDASAPLQTNKQNSTAFNDFLAPFTDSVRKFQKSVARNDKAAVAALINYPLRLQVIDNKKKQSYKTINNQREFLLIYDILFDEKYKESISQINIHQITISTSQKTVYFPGLIVDRFSRNRDNDFEIKITIIGKILKIR